jgi:hypothetical protein
MSPTGLDADAGEAAVDYRPPSRTSFTEPDAAYTSAAATTQRVRRTSIAPEWRESYGPTWWLDLLCLGAIVFALGAMLPLSDADLPMHLATGEWIIQHRAVPFVEPFAWTRMGAPYYAYSWAPEVIYYLALRAAGPLGLHLVGGAMLLGAAVVMLVLAHVARWRPWVGLCMAALNVMAAMLVVPSLRPQSILFVLVPLAWAWTYRIIAAPRIHFAMLALLLTSAAAANSHLFFVLTAAPIAIVVANPPADRWRSWAICGAIVGGWLMSPYALAWHDVFRLNFGYNALLVQPSPILEFRPGFRASTALLLALPLAMIPWVAPLGRLERRSLVVHGTLWLAGLMAFAYAGRLLLCWWLVTLPLAAAALGEIGGAGGNAAPRRAIKLASYSISVGLLIVLAVQMLPQWRREGSAASRRLPVAASESLEPLLVWLECHVKPGARGRVYTWFNYGSYLAWRLPGFSASIDGRTIFPDSVAKPEMLVSGVLPRTRDHVWASADLALIPVSFATASELDSAEGWKRAASLYHPGNPADSVALWVRSSWWSVAGSTELRDDAVVLTRAGGDAVIESCTNSATSPGTAR